ncbi:hypothetical protein HK104_004287 [Borealophlyctis nickersoniae]|nr:hypothetical protein HK104_004287 [Borealophlyctis nickersoniae]
MLRRVSNSTLTARFLGQQLNKDASFGNNPSEPTPSDVLSKNVGQIDISRLFLDEPVQDVEQEAADGEQTDGRPVPPPRTGTQEFCDAVYYAQKEVEWAWKVVDRLVKLGQLQSHAEGNYLMTSHAPERPPPPYQNQIQGIIHARLLRAKHLESLAEYVSAAAVRVDSTLQREKRFYADFALKLRQHNWILKSQRSFGPHNVKNHVLYVEYDFAHAGSDFPDRGIAGIWRFFPSPNAEEVNVEDEVEITMTRRIPKRVRIGFTRPGEKSREGQAVGLLAEGFWDAWRRTTEEVGTLKRLRDAQSALFEGEIFHEMVKEITLGDTGASDVRVLPRSVAMTTPDGSAFQMVLSDVPPGTGGEEDKSVERCTDEGTLFELVCQQTLRKLHRYNRAARERIARAHGRNIVTPSDEERPRVLGHLLDRSRNRHIERKITSIVQSAASKLSGTVPIQLNRSRAINNEVEIAWDLSLFDRWTFTCHLTHRGQIRTYSSLTPSHTPDISDMARIIWTEINTACLVVIREEADALGVAGEFGKWEVEEDGGVSGMVVNGSGVGSRCVVKAFSDGAGRATFEFSVPSRHIRNTLVVDAKAGPGRTFGDQVRDHLERLMAL